MGDRDWSVFLAEKLALPWTADRVAMSLKGDVIKQVCLVSRTEARSPFPPAHFRSDQAAFPPKKRTSSPSIPEFCHRMRPSSAQQQHDASPGPISICASKPLPLLCPSCPSTSGKSLLLR
jgi:hypothetical protein